MSPGYLVVEARQPVARLLLAHGAGAPMDSDFMDALAHALAEQGISTMRFEFPYMALRRETDRRRPPDRAAVLLDSWRNAYAQAGRVGSDLPLLIGGKSLGGRMASMLVDELSAAALYCYGYPFHPPGRPDKLRTDHLATLKAPALIVQGTRDPFGKPDLVEGLRLSPRLAIHWLPDGDHDFKPRRASGQDQQGLIQAAAEATRRHLDTHVSAASA